MSGSGAVPYPSSCLVFCALLHHCYFFACHLPCSQATYLSLLLLILKWLLLAALGYGENLKKNWLLSSSYLLLLFSQVKFNGVVFCLPAKFCVTLTYCVVQMQFTHLSSVFHKNTQSLRWADVWELPSYHLAMCNALFWDSIKVLDIFFYNAGISAYVGFSGWAELEGLNHCCAFETHLVSCDRLHPVLPQGSCVGDLLHTMWRLSPPMW